MPVNRSTRKLQRWITITPLFFAAFAFADTVTTTDNLSVYGTIKNITLATITVEGVFQQETKTYVIAREKVTRIDLNSTTYNPGAPPKTLGLGPGDGKKAPSAQAFPDDTIVLRGNASEPCKLVAIDESSVHCEQAVYPRSRALYILVGHGQ
jgi:hypothetical protein